MSVSLREVLESAGYDPANDVEDARWLFAQFNDYDNICAEAGELLDMYDDYQEWCDELEDSGESCKIMSFREWRKVVDDEAKK